ncbi:MAG: sulfur oxidation c-type cytochrome SoxX [Casimicrobiaceae bacterium]
MKRTLIRAFTLVAAALIVVGCASVPSDADLHADTVAMLKASFKAKGQATMDRLDQDETQRVCSEYFGKALPPAILARIEKSNLDAIKWPADGKSVGDWKAGEKIAQLGQGKQYSDDPSKPSGGNCYACHQLAPQEISYGTIGPSLYRFGKLRGYTDEMRKYAYGKVYNTEAYSACSNMPRFGAHGILTEQQMKDVVALLMDPKSPVNQ